MQREKRENVITYFLRLLKRMAKQKIKPLIPSLREKKRYIVYEMITRDSLEMFADPSDIEDSIMHSALDYLGSRGMADAGMIVLRDRIDMKRQKGIIRVANKSIDNIRSSLMLIDSINDNDVIVRTVGVSGVLKKAQNNYISG